MGGGGVEGCTPARVGNSMMGRGGGVYTCTYRQLRDGHGSNYVLVAAASSFVWTVVWTEAPFEVMEDIVQLKQQGLPVCEGIGLVGLNSCGLDVSRLLQFLSFLISTSGHLVLRNSYSLRLSLTYL